MQKTATKIMRAGVATAVFAGLVFAVSASAQAEKVVWNFNMFGPKRAVTAGLEKMKVDLEAAGKGQFELKINYGDALGPHKQNPENIKAGAFEAGQLCVGYYPNRFPLLSVMELPFLPPADLQERAKVEMAVMNNPLIVKELADRWNMKFFGPTFLPPYEFMGNKRIKSVDDMKGVKMRISGLNAKVLHEFGAVPTMVTAPEGYNALDRGTIDSFGFPYAYAFGAYKLYEVSKYVTEGIRMNGFMCFQGVNLDAWNKTPEAVKQAMPAAQQDAIEAMIAAYEAADAKWIPIFKQKLKVDEFPASERAKLVEGASSVWEQWVKDQEDAGRPGRQMLDFVKAQVKKYSH
jgi:TRAP-type C4-dicarboxylate transport system substrate-binding protein